MKTLYVVRHGETASNANETFQSLDTSLAAEGLKQAETLALRLKKLPVDAIVSSDLPRARQTAEKIGLTLKKDPVFSLLFREKKDPSSVLGKSYSDSSISDLRNLRDEHLEDASWRYEDEETFFEVKQRAEECLAFLLEQKEEHIVTVTHGGFLRFMLGVAVFGDAFTPGIWKKIRFGFMTSNTGITVLKYDAKQWAPGWSCLIWNDHAHLG